MPILAENECVGGDDLYWHYISDFKITDVNNGEQFIQLDVYMLMPEERYAMFVLNQPIALDKWMVLLVPECQPVKGEIQMEFNSHAFETTMNCFKIPPRSAVTWCRKVMTSRNSLTIVTSRPLSCTVSNIRRIQYYDVCE